jgi:hypothetical protein
MNTFTNIRIPAMIKAGKPSPKPAEMDWPFPDESD